MTVTTPRPAIPIGRKTRASLGLPDDCYDKRGRFTMNGPRDARVLASRYAEIYPGEAPSPSDLYGAAHIFTAWRLLMSHFASEKEPYEQGALKAMEEQISGKETDTVLEGIMRSFPDDAVWHGRRTPGESIRRTGPRRSGREWTVKNWTLINLAVSDPAFAPFGRLFDEYGEKRKPIAPEAWDVVVSDDKSKPARTPEDLPPVASLRRPIDIAPTSVKDQLLYILSRWGKVLGDWAAGLIGALDMIEEETRPRFHGPGPAQKPGFADLDEYARFSRDDDWMPRVVLMAKNVLVWLDQLSRRYQRPIRTLDAIPEEELSLLASRGFNALWLIGLWERSAASREIKKRMGNPEAHASAYSLFGYEIAGELGGWEALERLRDNAERHGIRLSSDMVPNHVGIDSDWVRQYPHRLLAVENCPFPGYRFESENLSADSRVDIRLEDHYWERTDAAVVFKRTENATGRVDYVYHGNDGTTMPWNDTAQIDFLNPEAREAVIEDILHVARNFPIIRFDAAMVLATKHIRRLWYPAPGAGGAIPSRSEHALSDEEFLASCPTEFWREVVDRVAAEVPGTLLLAEAFWMMEGYFVRTLGMHRVYNSAFMNMLRDKKNAEYRDLIKETIVFDPGILQRFVNFMNNPDEETAVEQFGKDDRYFAACTLLATLPGLPMVGHGQVEGLSEKYGMEYVRAYRDEHPDDDLIARHEREIFPLLARRHVFAGAESFRLYDLFGEHGVNENVFAFSNASGSQRSLVLVNNAFERAAGSIHKAAAIHDDLASALGIGNAPEDAWLLLREHVSGLWFIRAAKELRDHGLKVVIDGFGRQVFLDFRLITDDPEGMWRRLAAELDGGGTPDPDEAIRDIRLRPIRNALDALISRNLLADLTADIASGKQPKWPMTDAILDARLSDLAASDGEIHGVGHLEDVGEARKALLRRLKGSAKHQRLLGGGIRRRLNRRFDPEDVNEALLLASWAVISSLISLCTERSSLETWDEWGLDKWIQGILPVDAPWEVSLLKTVLADESWFRRKKTSRETLRSLMESPEIRSSCGVHWWDGTHWYNKEGWNATLRALVLTAAADTRGLLGRMRMTIRMKRLMQSWSDANRLAEYHFDELLEKAR